MRNEGAFPLPISVEGATAEWLTAALRTSALWVTVLSAELFDDHPHELLAELE